MPALSSPWFHQSSANQAIPPVVVRTPASQSSMSEAEMEEINKRLSRPTTSSAAKISMSWKLQNTYMEKGRHSWEKMELFEDCKKCIWTKNGTVKPSCKIRPLKKHLLQ
ncbi:hypothetical protein ACJMK2_030992 [Sinanodonta woodiana]|uniref:Uncharacterized protein n=1 Tax=Sinanodonta woodiana TaxID=1069815 RepID=A0ABD3WXG9_SINWO